MPGLHALDIIKMPFLASRFAAPTLCTAHRAHADWQSFSPIPPLARFIVRQWAATPSLRCYFRLRARFAGARFCPDDFARTPRRAGDAE